MEELSSTSGCPLVIDLGSFRLGSCSSSLRLAWTSGADWKIYWMQSTLLIDPRFAVKGAQAPLAPGDGVFRAPGCSGINCEGCPLIEVLLARGQIMCRMRQAQSERLTQTRDNHSDLQWNNPDDSK